MKHTGECEMAGQFFSGDEERLLEKIVGTALRTKPSVPCESPCPEPEIIRALAFHQKLDLAIVKSVALHTTECYECAALAEKYVNEYREEQKKGNSPAD